MILWFFFISWALLWPNKRTKRDRSVIEKAGKVNWESALNGINRSHTQGHFWLSNCFSVAGRSSGREPKNDSRCRNVMKMFGNFISTNQSPECGRNLSGTEKYHPRMPQHIRRERESRTCFGHWIRFIWLHCSYRSVKWALNYFCGVACKWLTFLASLSRNYRTKWSFNCFDTSRHRSSEPNKCKVNKTPSIILTFDLIVSALSHSGSTGPNSFLLFHFLIDFLRPCAASRSFPIFRFESQ